MTVWGKRRSLEQSGKFHHFTAMQPLETGKDKHL